MNLNANNNPKPPNRRAKRSLNRNHKDSLFRVTMRKKDNFRATLNAATGSDYGPDTLMEETTLANAAVMDEYNDVSFKIDGKIVAFFEHQSSINENMPLRMLGYAYNSILKDTGRKELYAPKAVEIPDMLFIVFYNGDKPFQPRKRLYLSDMRPEDRKNFPPNLELIVDIYNINTGNNPEIADACRELGEYEAFVEIARKHWKKTRDREETLKRALAECERRKILQKFIKTYSREIENMVLTEWSLDAAKEVWQEEAWEEGREKGREEGIGIGEKRGMAEVLNLVRKGVSPDEIERRLNIKSLKS